jgi:hypothetical protein
MKHAIPVALLVLLTLPAITLGQDDAKALPDVASYSQNASNPSCNPSPDICQRQGDPPPSSGVLDPAPAPPSQPNGARFGLGNKFGYYMTETYLNPSAITAPAFRAGLRMANPPSKGATQYPPEWRHGAEAFGRNYGDAFAERVSFQTARFVAGAIIREDPRYVPSSSHNVLARSLHAVSFTFVDRSDSGHRMPALSNFVGAAAAGFVGNAYLPAGFNDVTHAGQRATIRFGFAAGGNLFHEFAPQMPGPVRNLITLIAR